MVTYTTPIRRGEQLVGVLTLDLSVQYFEVLRGWLKEVNLGGNSYGFVISPSGVIISHPHERVRPGTSGSYQQAASQGHGNS